MSDVVFREGAHVRLRPLEREDVPLMRRWLNDPETTQYLLRAFPLMEKAEEAWFDALSGSTTDYVLGIVARESDALIGTIGLHRIDWRNRTATTGTIIGEKEWRGKGQGTEAKMLLLDFAFNALSSTLFSHASWRPMGVVSATAKSVATKKWGACHTGFGAKTERVAMRCFSS